jgi:hypothetical protein
MIKPFKDFDYEAQSLQEGFTNLLPQHEDLKRRHVDAVWDLLQHSYSKIGGIHGSGFESKEDMIKKIPMWKIGKTNGRINSVVLYKDKEGRKSVAMGTDGTGEGKQRIAEIMHKDLDRSYGEKSGPALSFMKRHTPDGFPKKYAMHYDEVKKIAKANGHDIRRAPEDDPEVLRHPELKDHFYQREIGGEWHTKAMFGVSNKKIT